MTSAHSDDPIDGLLALARDHLETGRDAAAVELFSIYVQRRPGGWKAWWLFGSVLRSLGRKREARRALLNALRLTRKHKGAVAAELGMLYDERGNRRLAEKWFALAAAAPDMAGVDWPMIMRGANLAAWEKFDEAVACYRTAIDAHGNNEDEAHLNIGKVLRAQRDFAGAAIAYRKALEITPDYAEAITDLSSLDGVGAVDDALTAESNTMPSTHSDSPTDRLRSLAREHLDMGREAAAAELLEAYVARRPTHADGWWRYGNALRILGRKTEARQALLTSLRLTSTHKGAVAVQMGMLYEGLGRRERAEKWFARATGDPEMGNLDWPWILRGLNLSAFEKFDEAAACYRKAISIHADDEAEAYQYLGNVMRAQRDYQGAEAAYHNALEIAHDSADAMSLLASLNGVDDALNIVIPALDE